MVLFSFLNIQRSAGSKCSLVKLRLNNRYKDRRDEKYMKHKNGREVLH